MGMDTRGSGFRSDINVTPLVDVCLVLLIIFMVAVPKSVPEISVRVPPDADPSSRNNNDDSIVLRVIESGEIELNRKPIARQDLEAQLSRLLQHRDRRVVFFDGAPGADFGAVVKVLDIAKHAGADVLGVMTPRNHPVPERLPPR